MNPASVPLGAVFTIDSGGELKEHPWVVVAKSGHGTVLCVNWTDASKCLDDTCILRPGDHTAVQKESAVFYCGFQELPENSLAKELASGKRIKPQANLAPGVFERILSGAKCHPDWSDAFKRKFGLKK